MRACVVLGVLSALFLTASSAGASDDPYRDQAERITCPSAPPGWIKPGENEGGKSILTPLTAVEQTDDPSVIVGAPVVQVDCHYRTAAGRDMQLSVRYALPIDLNPYNDFYVGCTTTGHPQSVATAAHPWNDRERVFRVVGAKTWSLATFIDALGFLHGQDVPRFEAMTKAMLNAAQPFAHDCKLSGNGAPVRIKTIWTFNFSAKTTSGGVTSSAASSGSFVTTASSTSTAAGAISNLQVSDFRLKVSGSGKTRWFGIRVGDPIEFRHGYGTILRADAFVTGSTDTACRKGSKGSLTISLQPLTPASVAVQVCGHTYLNGKGAVSAVIKTV
jgi:hypothetical protein